MFADSSVWIDFLRGQRNPASVVLDEFIGRTAVLVGDLIVYELLAGVRGEAEAKALRTRLNCFPRVAMAGEEIAVEAARIYRALRLDGITIRKTVDLLIGTYCIVNDHFLLQRDRDFAPMQAFGLKLWPA